MARLPEQRAWDTIRDAVDPWKVKLFRVENPCVDGMSDVIGINKRKTVFWVENKALAQWPARHTTCPMNDVFEPGQLPFMRQWKHWGGHAFVLLRVDKEFILLDPVDDLVNMQRQHIPAYAIAIGKANVCRHLEEL